MEERVSWSIKGASAQARHLAKLMSVQYGVPMSWVVEAGVKELWAYHLTRPAGQARSFAELVTGLRNRWLPAESGPVPAPGRRRSATGAGKTGF